MGGEDFKWITIICQILLWYVEVHAEDIVLPKYLQDMIDEYKAQHAQTGTTEECPTIDPKQYLYTKPGEPLTPGVSKTTSYLDRFPTGPEGLTFLSSEINMFTNFHDDDEWVYTGPTMDPNDLLGLDLGNTDGWRHFEVDGKMGPLQCPNCKKKFMKEKNYFNHLLQVENMTTPVWFAPTYTLPERYKNIPVTCPDRMCKDELKNYGYLRLHLLECHNGLPHNWNITSDEYLRDSVKEELSREQREYIAGLQSARPRRTYSRRSNTTRARRTRVTNGTTRLKRKYERRKNSSRLPRRESTWNTKLYSIIDEDYRKNVTGWLNEYHEV